MKWFSAYEERGVIALLKGVPKTKKRKPTRADDMKSVLNEAMSSFITFQRESEQRMLSFITFQRASEQRMLSFITFQRESEQRMLSFEERRVAEESETDDRRLGEAREHELVMYRLLAGMPSGQATPVGWAEQHAPRSNPVFSFTRRREHTKITFPLVKTTVN